MPLIDRYDYSRIPPAVMESLLAWQSEGRATGGFLRAVLSNDLAEAVGRADDDSLDGLAPLHVYIFNEIRSDCWGSPQKVREWPAKIAAELGDRTADVSDVYARGAMKTA